MIPVYLLLPAFVYGKISVYVDLSIDPPLIDVSGHSESLITEKERLTFKLDDANLKKSVEIFSNATPTDVYVRNSWGDLYKNVGWEEVHRSIRPTLETKTDTKTYGPQCVSVPFEQNTNMTVSNVWNNSTISTNESSEYDIVYNSKVTLKINSTWGKDINEFKSYSFPETKPNMIKCKLNVYLEYEGTLWGDVAVNYLSKMNGSHFWKFDVNSVQTEAKLPTSILYKENMTIEYFKYSPGEK